MIINEAFYVFFTPRINPKKPQKDILLQTKNFFTYSSLSEIYANCKFAFHRNGYSGKIQNFALGKNRFWQK
jgi:hypothetical protein